MFLFQQAFCHFSCLKGGVGENIDVTPFPPKKIYFPLGVQKRIDAAAKTQIAKTSRIEYNRSIR